LALSSLREVDPVQGARHVDVGKQHMDPRLGLVNTERFSGVFGLKDQEAMIDKGFQGQHADQGFVFDDEDNR
jgi:hypothetical protein